MLDLNALLVTAKMDARIKTHKQAINSRLAQKATVEQIADEAARQQAKRDSLERALSSDSLDAMRFRWLAENHAKMSQLEGLSLGELRTTIDLWIKRQATTRLVEMRKEFAERTGRNLPLTEFERA